MPPEKFVILPNTAGVATADERSAPRGSRAREAGVSNLVKIEVIGDRDPLPRRGRDHRASRVLVNEGFIVLPYVSTTPVACKSSRDIGCAPP